MSAVEGIDVVRRTPFGTNPNVGARGAKTLRRLLDAALDVFADVGYHDASVEHITRVAGCSRPTFYQYFESKEDLFRAIAGHLGRELVGLLDRLGDVSGLDGEAVLREWLADFADLYDEFAPVFAVFAAAAREDDQLPADSGALNARFGRALGKHLVIDSGLVDPGELAGVVTTMIVRANLIRHGREDLIDRDRFIDGLAALAHRVLRGPSASSVPERRRPRRLDPLPTLVEAPSENGEVVRNQLLAAAAEVFPLRGVHGTRVDDIVERAGVSHGTFYRYFENKDAVLAEVASRAAASLVELLGDIPTDGDRDAVAAWVTAWLDAYHENGALIALWREMAPGLDDRSDLTHSVTDLALSWLEAAVTRPDSDDPRVEAIAFLALIESVPHHVHGMGFLDHDDAVAALTVIIRRAFFHLDA